MTQTLQELIDQLPPEMEQELRQFVEFLLYKHQHRPHRKLKLDWSGGLREYREQYTSLELQKAALDWWTEECRTS